MVCRLHAAYMLTTTASWVRRGRGGVYIETDCHCIVAVLSNLGAAAKHIIILKRSFVLASCTTCLILCTIRLLPELHADLFSRRASPLEVCVLWRSTKEVNIMSDEICRRCDRKQQRRRRGGGRVVFPDWVMNKIKRQHTICLLYTSPSPRD